MYGSTTCSICAAFILRASPTHKFCADCAPAIRRAQVQAWLAAHPDRARERNREWRLEHPDRVREYRGAVDRGACQLGDLWHEGAFEPAGAGVGSMHPSLFQNVGALPQVPSADGPLDDTRDLEAAQPQRLQRPWRRSVRRLTT